MPELKGQLAELDRHISTGITDKVYSYLDKHLSGLYTPEELRTLAKQLIDDRAEVRRSRMRIVK